VKVLRKEARNLKEAAAEQALGSRKEFVALIFVLCFGLIPLS
jgi:hypothetical protein